MRLTSIMMEVLCTVYVTLSAIRQGAVLTAAEVSEPKEIKIVEDAYKGVSLEDSPEFVEREDPELRPKWSFKTAEIADAVLGTEVSVDPAGMESLIRRNAKAVQAGFSVAPGDLADGNGPEEMEPVTLGMVHVDAMASEEQNSTEAPKQHKVNCHKINVTDTDSLAVQILNASQDLMEFLNANSTECSLVLFYTTWCQFSASLAPHFNALPRVFPGMRFLALDASQHSSLSTRFGTVAVPNILLFQGVKPMARFNQTERTLETLTAFIANQTGFEIIPGHNVTEEDRSGPLPPIPVKGVDWLLVFSVTFIFGFTLYAILRTDSIRRLIPGQEHEHQD
ncbi:thioredoxin domain-containing protein 15 [Brienomyrus brachyistius]|uniref:thioredoxin domain-containing protein 15 n=1 Tax=Brienomyrus brachyistius TaxID=42636 RepID=UPI0020B22BA4|nr:thioredoxin domain-containing protein 15 [Brienomyrus brachyistius]